MTIDLAIAMAIGVIMGLYSRDAMEAIGRAAEKARDKKFEVKSYTLKYNVDDFELERDISVSDFTSRVVPLAAAKKMESIGSRDWVATKGRYDIQVKFSVKMEERKPEADKR